ncbi:MAG: aldo/keto reductase [Bacillota bacterium]
MEYNYLGNTGIKVSKLAFGTLTISPLQRDLGLNKSLNVLKKAIDLGINFFDTADGYINYKHLNNLLKVIDRKDIVISSKTYAYNKSQAKNDLNKALNQIGTDYIDIFMLHEQMNEMTIKGHWEAIEYLLEMKKQGKIRAIGISTHFISGVKAFKKYDELEVLHPIINKKGIGICDGNINEMIDELKTIDKSKGIFAMKALAGGNLLNSIDEAFDFILSLDFLDSIAVGMQNSLEVKYNVKRFNGKIDKKLKDKLSLQNRKIIIGDWCVGCGKCIKACQQKAISIVDNKALINRNKCSLCGYCASKCDEFCIKII